MISNNEWNNLSKQKQDELSEEAYSYRQCMKCENYIHLGEEKEDEAEGMYMDTYDFFDCSEEKIDEYQQKNNISLFDNVFCWSCIKTITNDLEIEE